MKRIAYISPVLDEKTHIVKRNGGVFERQILCGRFHISEMHKNLVGSKMVE